MIIYFWPDGTWRYQEEFDEIIDMWKGRDFNEAVFPDDTTDEHIDEWVEFMLRIGQGD